MKPSERAKAARLELEAAILDYLADRPEGALITRSHVTSDWNPTLKVDRRTTSVTHC